WQLLVIEDNRDIAAYIRDCVQDEYQVHLAHDGQEGIERALELIPEVIISDVMMPVKDGLEVLRTLKNDQRTSHIPIILLTAKATTDDRIIGLKEGADAYLSKPFHKEELLVRMEQMVKLRETLQQRYSQFVPAQAPVRALSLEEQFLQKVNECVEAELGNPELGAEQICRAT
ncbi:MAG: response regulator, partial [Saprospiraceae bacterium]|nr:response regulator [Saprospiraceae bacterium]